MSNIPAARDIVQEVLNDVDLPFDFRNKLQKALELMTREPAVRKTRKKLPKLTPELAERIRNHAVANVMASQLEIANFFNTNPGRVSEALNHLR